MGSKLYGRPLSDNSHAESFLTNVLHLDDELDRKAFNKYVMQISAAEMQLSRIVGESTLTHRNHRLAGYVEDSSRRNLRRDILQELSSYRRLLNDDEICLGKGGSMPIGTVQSNRQAFLIIGLPASGKSEISNFISDKYGAMILDSDYAKRKFPEYESDFGASILHAESKLVIFGGNGEYARERSLLEFAAGNGYNIVVPKIGDSKKKIETLANGLRKNRYEIHLILVRLDRDEAVRRAFSRYIKTGRYVSLPTVFDVYSNDPTITFYDIQNDNKHFKSFTMISSDVKIGEPKELLISSEYSPISEQDLISMNK